MIYLSILIGLGILLYWFRSSITNISIKFILLGFYSLFGGIFAGSLILFILHYFGIASNNLYGAIIGPFFEELTKFLVVVFIISSIQDDLKTANRPYIRGLSIGVLVGLGFGGYENFIYFNGGNTDIMSFILRTILVGGIMLHPLTSGIYGYIIGIIKAKFINLSLDKMFFVKEVEKVDSTKDFLIFAYKKINASGMSLLNFIKNILTLDLTINYIFGKEREDKHCHSRLEIIFESFFLGFWLHSLYNSILIYVNYSGTGNAQILVIQIVGIIIAILLKDLFTNIYQSKIFGYLSVILLILGFIVKGDLSQKLGIISLVFIITSLLIISWKLDKKLNPNSYQNN